MSFRYVIDAYAWVEYFRASEAGKKAKDYIESGKAATPTIVVAELYKKLLKEIELGNETLEEAERRLDFVRGTTRSVDLNFELAKKSAKVDLEMRKRSKGWRLADSIILAAARTAAAEVVTGDEHFRGLPEAIMIR